MAASSPPCHLALVWPLSAVLTPGRQPPPQPPPPVSEPPWAFGAFGREAFVPKHNAQRGHKHMGGGGLCPPEAPGSCCHGNQPHCSAVGTGPVAALHGRTPALPLSDFPSNEAGERPRLLRPLVLQVEGCGWGQGGAAVGSLGRREEGRQPGGRGLLGTARDRCGDTLGAAGWRGRSPRPGRPRCAGPAQGKARLRWAGRGPPPRSWLAANGTSARNRMHGSAATHAGAAGEVGGPARRGVSPRRVLRAWGQLGTRARRVRVRE